jgi:hypothetical protein
VRLYRALGAAWRCCRPADIPRNSALSPLAAGSGRAAATPAHAHAIMPPSSSIIEGVDQDHLEDENARSRARVRCGARALSQASQRRVPSGSGSAGWRDGGSSPAALRPVLTGATVSA